MPRIARVVAVGVPHHVTQRGNNRQQVFFSNAQRRYYLALLAEHARRGGLRVWGYCLMPNHIIAELARRLAAADISIDAVLQEPSFDRQDLPFVSTTEPAPRRAIAQALESMSGLEFLVGPPLALPLERGLGNCRGRRPGLAHRFERIRQPLFDEL